jgi:hypothetical protein
MQQDMAVHIIIGAQKFMRKSRGYFVCRQSARGLAQSKTLARNPVTTEKRLPSWSAAALRRFTEVHAEISRTFRLPAKRQPPSRRSGALARREGGRAGALQDAGAKSVRRQKARSALEGGGPPARFYCEFAGALFSSSNFSKSGLRGWPAASAF